MEKRFIIAERLKADTINIIKGDYLLIRYPVDLIWK